MRALFFFGIFFLFFSCDNFSYTESFKKFFKNKDKVKVLLLSSEFSLIKPNQKDIPYPYQDFVVDSYINSFLSNLNKNNSPLQVDVFESKEKKIDDSKVFYASSVDLVDNKKEDQIKKILNDKQYTLYAKIDASYSVWQQKVIGKINIFDDKSKVFEYRISKQSKEILLDKNSPYAIREENFFYLPNDKNETHANAIIKVFGKIGKSTANDIVNILERKKK